MDAITRDILAFYQIGEEARVKGHEATNLVAVVNQVLGQATDYAEMRRVDCHLTVAASARDVLVLGDRALIHRALEKVLQNALDYSTPGQVVAVHVEMVAGEAVCTLADSGPGVAEAALPHIFEPFFREDDARSGEGLGLGLAIAHTIMRAHDGRIEAENGPRDGLVVRLCWPVFS
jgi:signal transduction histidine kinase